jgi:hypothetical protein
MAADDDDVAELDVDMVDRESFSISSQTKVRIYTLLIDFNNYQR